MKSTGFLTKTKKLFTVGFEPLTSYFFPTPYPLDHSFAGGLFRAVGPNAKLENRMLEGRHQKGLLVAWDDRFCKKGS
jgi:hypothetical protein